MEWFFGRKNQDKIFKIHKKQTQLEKEFLTKATYESVDFFHLNGYSAWAKVASTYDGDTSSLIFFLNGKPVKFRCRLAEIDCAEKKSSDPAEIRHALRAVELFKELVSKNPDGLVYAKFHRFDKYGRLLVSIYNQPDDSYSFNDVLVGAGMAYEYHGGARKPFREWALKRFLGTTDNVNVIDNINDSEVAESESQASSSSAFRPETNIDVVFNGTPENNV